MKFVTVSVRGEGLPIAMKLQEEGHNSRFHSVQLGRVGEGFVDTIDEKGNGSLEKMLMRHVTKDTMVVFTNGDFGSVAENMQRAGYLTFGASRFHASLQGNSHYAQSLCMLYGINTVPEDASSPCVVEAWFNGEDFIYPIFGLFHEYGFMPGDVGVATECAGVTGFAFKNYRPAKFRDFLEKLKPALRKVDYRGPISIDVIGNAVVRFVCGFRFDFVYLMLGLIEQPFGRLLVDVARGMVKGMRTNFGYGLCVRATLPPYPHGASEPPPLVLGADSDLKDGLIPIGLRIEEKKLLLASHTGEAFCVRGFGPTIKDAQAQAFNTIARLMVPNLQFRIDIGSLALKHISALLQSDSKEDTGGKQGGTKSVSEEGRGSHVLPSGSV